jgi:phage shock protein C
MQQLRRAIDDRQICGLCGGLARLYGVDSNLVRMVAVFVLVATGFAPLLVAYLVGWRLVPEEAPI